MKMKLHKPLLVLLLLAVISCSKETVQEESTLQYSNATALEQELLGLINAYRSEMGKASLSFSAVAYEYANSHTDYMISKGALSHDHFSARASKITEEVNAEKVAENVAKDYSDAQAALDGWLGSPYHKETIEDNFTHTAISVKQDSSGNLYFTQLFYR